MNPGLTSPLYLQNAAALLLETGDLSPETELLEAANFPLLRYDQWVSLLQGDSNTGADVSDQDLQAAGTRLHHRLVEGIALPDRNISIDKCARGLLTDQSTRAREALHRDAAVDRFTVRGALRGYANSVTAAMISGAYLLGTTSGMTIGQAVGCRVRFRLVDGTEEVTQICDQVACHQAVVNSGRSDSFGRPWNRVAVGLSETLLDRRLPSLHIYAVDWPENGPNGKPVLHQAILAGVRGGIVKTTTGQAWGVALHRLNSRSVQDGYFFLIDPNDPLLRGL